MYFICREYLWKDTQKCKNSNVFWVEWDTSMGEKLTFYHISSCAHTINPGGSMVMYPLVNTCPILQLNQTSFCHISKLRTLHFSWGRWCEYSRVGQPPCFCFLSSLVEWVKGNIFAHFWAFSLAWVEAELIHIQYVCLCIHIYFPLNGEQDWIEPSFPV